MRASVRFDRDGGAHVALSAPEPRGVTECRLARSRSSSPCCSIAPAVVARLRRHGPRRHASCAGAGYPRSGGLPTASSGEALRARRGEERHPLMNFRCGENTAAAPRVARLWTNARRHKSRNRIAVQRLNPLALARSEGQRMSVGPGPAYDRAVPRGATTVTVPHPLVARCSGIDHEKTF